MSWYKESRRHAIAAMKGWRGKGYHSHRLAIDRSKQAKKVYFTRMPWVKERNKSDLAGYDTKVFTLRKLVATREIPAFIGADMKEYGPFNPGDIVRVPEKIESLLSNRKLAQRTNNPSKFKKKPIIKKIIPRYAILTPSEIDYHKNLFLRYMQEKQREQDMVPLEDIREELSIPKEDFAKLSQELQIKGTIYLPRHGFARLTRREE